MCIRDSGNTAKLNQMLTNAGPEAQCQAVSDVVGVDVSQYLSLIHI